MKYLYLPFAIAVTFIANHSLGQGYYSGTQGARAAGRAGAFTARADDVSAVELNPAGLAGIGTTIQVGNRFSHNAYDYRRQSTLDWGNVDPNTGNPPLVQFGTARNEKPWQFLDPFFGVATNLGLRDWGFAIAAYAPAGIARTQYSENGGQRYMMISRDSQIMNYTASVAWKLRDILGFGATFQWIAVPSLKYRLIVNGNPLARGTNGENPVTSGTDMRTTVSGSDPFTPNLILGTWLRPLPFLQVGLSAQVIPTEMHLKGRLAVDPVSLPDTVILTRGNVRADDVSLNLPLPIKLREGVRYRHIRDGIEVFDIEFDIAYEFWSRVGTFTMDSNGIKGSWAQNTINVGRIDIQKHWKNVVTLMLGGDYSVIPGKFTARAGTFYTSGLSDPAYAQIDFVSGPQLGGALGFSLFAGPLEVAAAYEYRHMLPVSLTERESRVYQQAPGSPCRPPYTDPNNCSSHYLGVPTPPENAGSYRANSHVAALDVLYRF